MSRVLKLDFQNFWHVGSGRSAGHHLDAVCLKDEYDLPFVSGKQLKGLLRHAVHRAETWGWYADFKLPEGPVKSFEELLFGSRSQQDDRHQTTAGMLFVDNAQLTAEEYQFLEQSEQSQLRQYLYQELFNTAIDPLSGTAVEHSLRGTEVALPMQLFALLEIKITALDAQSRTQQLLIDLDAAWEIIEQALPLIDAIGAHRSRGLGEVMVSLQVQD